MGVSGVPLAGPLLLLNMPLESFSTRSYGKRKPEPERGCSARAPRRAERCVRSGSSCARSAFLLCSPKVSQGRVRAARRRRDAGSPLRGFHRRRAADPFPQHRTERIPLRFSRRSPPGICCTAAASARAGRRPRRAGARLGHRRSSMTTLALASPNTFGPQSTLVILFNFSTSPRSRTRRRRRSRSRSPT